MKTKVKTIDIQAKTWFDKVNGNSYFAGIVTVNFGMSDEKQFKMPFQYGYGDQYIYEAFTLLIDAGLIPVDWKNSPSYHARENGVILRANNQKNCKQRELKNI